MTAAYRLEANGFVTLVEGNVLIPPDPAVEGEMPRPRNTYWVAYEAWLAEGGVPDPYVPPPLPPFEPSTEQLVTLSQENRIRALEGKPPLTMAEFIDQIWTQMKP